ncbi:translocation/assembly module TamB domain-containing protein [Legionella worsleiensis]|uniref:Periplasmic protein n=1 Tax=Legionella worsleiensis TaxID=45076 RepID=A0A0W1AIS0_9GAMM|nr:translocation/assembly module TamB domain-containing protein [Legionella worsleiensis]KTD81227.1 periplasmic protein [Legionella worsleiensis]STY33204.1 periplasmic protein [Legionella worsleiensis]
MIKLLKKLVYFNLFILIILITLFSFFLTTTPGLYTLLKLGSFYLPGTLKAHHIKGSLLDGWSVDTLEYQHDATHIKINQLQVSWHLNSWMQPQLHIKKLKAKSLELNEQATLNTVTASGLLTRHHLSIDSLRFNFLNHRIEGHTDVDLQIPHALSGTLSLNPQNANKSHLQGKINFGGKDNQLHWTGTIKGPGEVSIEGSLKQLTEINQVIKWRSMSWPILGQNPLQSPEGRIKISGTLPKLDIEIQTKLNQNDHKDWHINATIQTILPFNWQLNATVAPTQSLDTAWEGMHTILNIKGKLRDLNNGFMTLTVPPGYYQTAKDSSLPILKFSGGKVNASLTSKGLSGKGALKIDATTQMNINFNLPGFDLNKGLSPKQPLTADLTLLVNSFDFIKSLSPDISHARGHLSASLTAKGTFNKLLFASSLKLVKASISVPKLGLNLDPIDMTVSAKKNTWEARGTLNAVNKKISIKGQGILSANPQGELTLQGSDFPLVNTKEYQVNISPKLKLSLLPTHLSMSGTVVVPYAQIKPQSFSNSLTVSEDVVFQTHNKTPPPTPWNTDLDIKIEMGEQVALSFKGLDATLAGAVHLKQLPKGPVTANGELNVVKGKYKAYGQDLAIEQGELIFTGGRLDNPGINLRAAKKIDTSSASMTSSNQLFDFNNNNLQNANLRGNISVGVEVTGRLTSPKIQLFSNPSVLSQADILSMLVLGRPASQANKAGAQLLLAAISSMNLGTGTNGAQLLDQLKQNLGFDFDVQTNSNFNLVTNQVSDNTALVVGKSLSKRMYLSYNVGLSQADPNVLTLKYLLNQFLSIQVSSSDEGNGIDFFYTSSKD